MRNTYTILLLLIFLCSCSTAPKITPGKGAIFGTITANSHKDILAKAKKNESDTYTGAGGIVFTEQMINYPNLKDLFVCLIDPSWQGGIEHILVVNNEGISHRSLAIGKGDRLTIRNGSSKTLTFFLSGKEDDIQIFSPTEQFEIKNLSLKLRAAHLRFNQQLDRELDHTLKLAKALWGEQVVEQKMDNYTRRYCQSGRSG